MVAPMLTTSAFQWIVRVGRDVAIEILRVGDEQKPPLESGEGPAPRANVARACTKEVRRLYGEAPAARIDLQSNSGSIDEGKGKLKKGLLARIESSRGGQDDRLRC